jgi:putative transposase
VTFAFIEAEKANFPVRFMCDRLGVSASGFYEWRHAQAHPCARRVEDAELLDRIRDIHRMSRRSYGSPRVHDELRLGEGRRVGRKRIERLMRTNGIVGIHKRRRGCTRRDPDATPAEDLVNRQFTVNGPDKLWVSDITEHPTGEGKVYIAVVLDAWSRRVIGWSIADHIRAELVVDALQMAIWRRRPPEGQTVHHSDHGSQYTSWAFGRRLRAAGVLGSMGSVGDAYDNAMAESFFSTLQRELLDQQPRWATRHALAQAVFEWIEAWYNPRRRHSSIGRVSPVDFETAHRGDGLGSAA